MMNEKDLAEMIKGADGPLRIKGGQTRPIGDAVDATGVDVTQFSGVTLYEPGSLTVVVEAGTPLTEVQSLLAKERQMLAFEPMDHRHLLGTNGEPTIGGAVAANISGPRRIQTGACRDHLLGVRFVDGRGNIVKNGGRVMKNVTGYDLVKLMAGSFGTLGVLTEVSLKVLPAPQAQATVVLEDLTAQKAVSALSKALASPYDVTGAAHVPMNHNGVPSTMIRLEGFKESVSYRSAQLADLLKDFGTARIETTEGTNVEIWRAVRDVTAFGTKPGDV